MERRDKKALVQGLQAPPEAFNKPISKAGDSFVIYLMNPPHEQPGPPCQPKARP
ncbi:hypothetical protein [Paucibacter soli]|uniref:hypothetical protein n=1 Tax=Paucibacter soli TaxID=3133433 RepID=UPI00309B4113